MIAQMFFALIFFNMVIVIMLLFIGFPITSPTAGETPELWEMFFALANASVAEEIFTRTVYIGLPLLAFDFLVRKRTKELFRYFIGGGFKIEHITIFLIILSSILFGLAHYPSWGLWKVFPTFAAGLAFGYLFVRKGIHTAIILHFLFDYMLIILAFFSGNIAILMVFSLLLLLVMLFWIFSGLIYFIVYINRIFEFFVTSLFGPPAQPTPAGAGSAGTSNLYPSHRELSHRENNRKYYTRDPLERNYPYGHPYYQFPPRERQLKPGDTSDTANEHSINVRRCTYCKKPLTYVPYYGRFFCESCLKYEP
jgi:hypothetical protein